MLSIDLEDSPDNWTKVRDFLNQPSMFVDSKLVVVKEIGVVPRTGGEKEWAKVLKNYLETPKTFILISDEKAPRSVFKFLLKEPVKSQVFLELEGSTLEAFLKKEATERNLSFDPKAWRFFCSYITSQEQKSWLAVNELEKLALAKFNQPISLDNLRLVVRWHAKEKTFLMAGQILRTGDFREKLRALEQLFLQKEAPAYIFNSLAYQAKGEAVLKLADYDVSIKSGGLEYEEALTDFCLESRI